jgi:cytochrome P450
MKWTENPRLLLRWMVMHGLVRLATRRWARDGDPQAMLIADPATRLDPAPLYERIRASGPLSRTKVSHITVDHSVAHSVLRSDDFRTISIGANVPPALRWIERGTRGTALHPLQEPSLLAVEPPSHTRYRTLVSSVFTARAVAALREQVQVTADALLDSLVADGDGAVDIVARYCALLPVSVIGDILGVPAADRERVLSFGELAAPSLDIGLPFGQYLAVEKGLVQFDTWLGNHLATLRRTPGNDLMSQLARASTEGQMLDDRELRATAGLVLAAGFETTVNLLGSGVKLLMDHPDQLALLRAQPEHWPTAVDEVLRLESPVQLTARVARRDTELAGLPVAAGETVVLVLAGANRDPAVFTDPGTFDVRRANANRHLSFSGGRHFCLGAALARAEGEVGLRSLFDRFPELSPSGTGSRRPTRVLRGWASLPVRLGPAVRLESAVG